jgi:hypothetical protein
MVILVLEAAKADSEELARKVRRVIYGDTCG